CPPPRTRGARPAPGRSTSGGTTDGSDRALVRRDPALRQDRRGSRCRPRPFARLRHRARRPQRRGQDDADQAAPGPDPARQRRGARRGRGPGRQRGRRRPPGARVPARERRLPWCHDGRGADGLLRRPQAPAGGTQRAAPRAGRHRARGRAPDFYLLEGHAPAPGHRPGPDRRSPPAPARRADQRPRPGLAGRRLRPDRPAAAGRRHGARLDPCACRDRASRRQDRDHAQGRARRGRQPGRAAPRFGRRTRAARASRALPDGGGARTPARAGALHPQGRTVAGARRPGRRQDGAASLAAVDGGHGHRPRARRGRPRPGLFAARRIHRGGPMNVWLLALQEIRVGLRNRWVVATTLVLGALSLSLARLGSAPTGEVKADSLAIIVVSLASLSIFLLPLIALLLSYDAIVGEQERGTLVLLLSYPVARWQVVLGKVLGHTAILAFATIVGYGSAGVALWLRGDADAGSIGAFAAMVLTSIMLGASFVAMGCLASTVVRERATAAGLAVGAWLFFVLVYDTAVLGLLVADQGRTIGEQGLNVLLLLNPTD